MTNSFAQDLRTNASSQTQRYLFDFTDIVEKWDNMRGKSKRYIEAEVSILIQQLLRPSNFQEEIGPTINL